ncbi:putative F-box/kelch-repeat protein At3g22730 [Salvia hispanica]|uniref:putative F-box/kelch-repeat protein At3g22730 n=1 Tax=Salvia hispanica TaxID=49212 RepID=UPI00200916C7|nr:putative F-box/kelch-repeat protein At3g22730 [Salvia hispanica]
MGFAVCDEACKPLYQFAPPQNQYYFSLPRLERLVVGSANGLLLAWDGYDDILFVCNPFTSEYIELPRLPLGICITGFGVSKISGQYKILCGNQNHRSYHVYTLGRGGGCWRSIAVAPTCGSIVSRNNVGVFFNGNLHWLALGLASNWHIRWSDLEKSIVVCCFDLETELFTSFSLPPRDNSNEHNRNWMCVRGDYQLCVLEDRLCLCNSIKYPFIVIWSMNIYGDTNSWVKAYTIERPQIGEVVFPLKAFANGDLFFAVNTDNQVFTYNKNTNECLVSNGLLDRCDSKFYNIVTYIPSFLSLAAMGIPNVKSLSFY